MKSIIMFLLEVRYGLALRQAWQNKCAGMDFQEWVISYLSLRPTLRAADEGYCEHNWSFPPKNCPVCNKRVPLIRLHR